MERFYVDPVKAADIREVQTTLLVNDQLIPLNDFTQRYLGNVMRGIVKALGQESQEIKLYMDEGLRLYTEAGEVPLYKDFSKIIIESTIKGVLSPLKDIFWFGRVSIYCKYVKGKN